MMQHLTKRFLLIEMVLTLAAWTSVQGAPTGGRAAQLEALKAQFPSHVAGAVTEKSDPIVRVCYLKYKKMIAELTVENLPDRLAVLRESLDDDIEWPSGRQNMEHVRHGPSNHAEQQNLAWLKQKMLPYLKRLEQFQRGR